MELVIGKNSNMTGNALLVMLAAGVLAAIGIATNALHIVIGAMLIAPGYPSHAHQQSLLKEASRRSNRSSGSSATGFVWYRCARLMPSNSAARRAE
ncbi:MAG: hypothetical protein FJX68_19690 [Alphaproteobacteria bacterium]|nr:hypothetical protein [Alphaproteobacteria bacterium]